MELTKEQVNKIAELKNLIRLANRAYRLGEPIMEDPEYDALEAELVDLEPIYIPEPFLEDIDERKEKLPYIMASLNKVKTLEDIKKWVNSKGIPTTTEYILTPKYDGMSLCVKEKAQQAWTGGQDGIHGRKSHEHFKIINRNCLAIPNEGLKTIGEVIMAKSVFKAKYIDSDFIMSNGKKPANARNFVGGLLNKDEPSEILKDTLYIRYSTNLTNLSKVEQLNICNTLNEIVVPYHVNTIGELTEEYLKQLFFEWREDFDIDGIVIDINDAVLRNKLGRETSTENPCFARAYKGNFEEVKETILDNIEWTVSKQGFLQPVGIVRPVNLDGATVSRVTLFNAAYVKHMKIRSGVKILIKRSGAVIPYLVKVLE